jgi:benzoyl-CoA reductase/2-hydroxyglutaryl-CoA dehydratase subunit BcrC/BadD/HgdB
MSGEKKEKTIKRLKAMYPLRSLVDKMYERAVEYNEEGKPTAWCMVNWWGADAVLRTMDIAAVYPEDYGAVCAAFGTAQAFLDRCNSDGFPDHLCGYARNGIGYASRMKELGGIPPEAPMSGMPKPTLLLCSGYFCDTRYKWFQSLGRYLDAPVWLLEMPHPGVRESLSGDGTQKHIIEFMVKELREFIAFLEHLVGKKMDWDKLDEVVNDLIEMNRVWHEVNELRKAKPCPMHSRDFWSCMPASLYVAEDPGKTAVLYRNLYDEVKEKIDKKEAAIPEEKYRLAFAELPPWHSLGFFDKLAERGWNFVVESWSYHPPKPTDLSKISNPLERIARHTYRHFAGFFEEAYKNGEHLGYFGYPYLDYVKEYECDALVAHPLLTCRTATNHLAYVQDRLMKVLKVPTIVIEGDIVDLKHFNPEEALTRAEAFEEVIEHYREVRKKG